MSRRHGGAVFAAAAGELLPGMLLHDKGAFLAVLAGAALGVAAMLASRAALKRVGESAGLIAVVGIDVLIDGFVVGLGFIAGASQGLLLTIALSIELLFLGLSVAVAVGGENASKVRIVLGAFGVALLLPLGAAAGTLLFQGLAQSWLTGFFAFGLVALLYLVTEELLVEAHEKLETPFATAVFFVGSSCSFCCTRRSVDRATANVRNANNGSQQPLASRPLPWWPPVQPRPSGANLTFGAHA